MRRHEVWLLDAESGEVGEVVTAALLEASIRGATLGTWSLSEGCTLAFSDEEIATLVAFESDGAAMNGDIRIDDLVLDTTDQTFPLGPR